MRPTEFQRLELIQYGLGNHESGRGRHCRGCQCIVADVTPDCASACAAAYSCNSACDSFKHVTTVQMLASRRPAAAEASDACKGPNRKHCEGKRPLLTRHSHRGTTQTMKNTAVVMQGQDPREKRRTWLVTHNRSMTTRNSAGESVQKLRKAVQSSLYPRHF
jgi:hypothetical protein